MIAAYRQLAARAAERHRVPVAARAETEAATRDDGLAVIAAPTSGSPWRRLTASLARFASALVSMVDEVLRAAWPEVKRTIAKAVVANATEWLTPDVATVEERSRQPSARRRSRGRSRPRLVPQP